MTKTIPQLTAATLPVDSASLMEISIPGGGSRKLALADLPGPLTAVVPLTASQVNHLFSVPQPIIEAPGAGKAIIVISAQLAETVESIPFDSENGDATVYYGSADGYDLNLKMSNVLSSRVVFGGILSGGSATFIAYTGMENLPIVAAGTGEDMVNGGAIATATVNAGGAGYAPGDTGTVNPQTTATYVVDTVDGGGAVTTFHFSDAGYGNNAGTGITTNANTGIGTGFTMNITGITPGNGSALVLITYVIITLP